MKRKISIVLILVIVLSMFSGFVYAEGAKSPVDVLNLIGGKVKIVSGGILALDIFDYYLTPEKINELQGEIKDYEQLKTGLSSDGLTKDMIKSLMNFAKGLSSADLEDIGSKKSEIIKIVGDGLVNRFRTIRDQKSNSDFAYEVIEEMITKSNVVGYDTYTGKFTVNFASYKNENTIKGYLSTMFPETFGDDSKINEGLNTAQKILVYILNDDEDFNTYKEALKGLLRGYKGFYEEYSSAPIPDDPGDDEPSDDPGGSSGGGGGGGAKTETPSEEETKVEDGKAQVELGKDAVEVKTGDKGQSVVAVKSESIKAAVEDLAKIVKEDPTAKPTVIIKLDDVETAAMEVSVPKDAMTKLIENKVGLVIESKSLSYEIPAEALQSALKDVPEDAQIEFSSEIISVEEAEKLFTDENIAKTAKVIQFSLSIKDKDGNEIGKVNKFDAKIQISIEIEEADGNPDLLGVFYINEETGALEFVGGKIKDNKIIAAIDHYSKLAMAEYDKSFSDIEKHWSKDYVKSMVAKHVIDGFEDNTYRPEDQLTRAQFAKLLVEALELDMVLYEGGFEDVDATHWAKDYIATAKQQGIIAGYGDGTFKPGQFINRSEMATMITNALRLNKNASATGLKKFQDVQEIPAWAVEYMAPVVAEGLLVGSDGMLNPLGYVTRAEAATITYRVYNR